MIETLAASLGAKLIETHISWVLLAGEDAWKVKKPVRLAFVDYGTLAARRFFCAEEVRLNARLAPSLYLGVVPVTGTRRKPVLGGEGKPIEYAVHMRRFPAGALFSEMLEGGSLEPAHVDALARRIARFHASLPRAPDRNGFATPQRRLSAANAALDGLRAHAPGSEWEQARAWLMEEAARLAPLWRDRRARGCVRECHGDLHLSNVVLLDGEVLAFDGIEFDPMLRWIDVLDDISFAVMDFEARGHSGFAWRLLNAWLDETGDHHAVPGLRFSACYRALVRAHVASLRGDPGEVRRYLDAALRWMRPRAAALTITHGLPGSGKTFQSQRLLETEGAIRLRSDVERKRLFGIGMLESSRARGVDIYSSAAGERTYAYLLGVAKRLLSEGWPVIIDAAFLRQAERRRALALAVKAGLPFSILECDAPLDVLRERLRARTADASEADEGVLRALLAGAEPLSPAELARVQPAERR